MRAGSMGNPVAGRAERSSSGRGAIRAAAGDQPKRKTELRKVMPEVWKLVRPRRWLLLFGLVLVAINRVSGLILPLSTKYLIDGVLSPRNPHAGKLLPLVGVVFGATAIQAATSFSLTQLMSKAAQRMIADLRKQVQQHIGRLSVSFYDSNRTGVLVSRIMNDVEGVRNLIGTGLVEFVGGMLTAVIVFCYLVYNYARMTLIVFVVILAFVLVLQKALKVIRRSSGSATKSAPRFRGGSPNRWVAFASSRAITPRSARRRSLRLAYSGCWTT